MHLFQAPDGGVWQAVLIVVFHCFHSNTPARHDPNLRIPDSLDSDPAAGDARFSGTRYFLV
jgi:hypothetical protein